MVPRRPCHRWHWTTAIEDDVREYTSDPCQGDILQSKCPKSAAFAHIITMPILALLNNSTPIPTLSQSLTHPNAHLRTEPNHAVHKASLKPVGAAAPSFRLSKDCASRRMRPGLTCFTGISYPQLRPTNQNHCRPLQATTMPKKLLVQTSGLLGRTRTTRRLFWLGRRVVGRINCKAIGPVAYVHMWVFV